MVSAHSKELRDRLPGVRPAVRAMDQDEARHSSFAYSTVFSRR